MTFDTSRLADPEFFAENRLAARSDHVWYANRAEADSGHSSFCIDLNGTWRFHYAENPEQTIRGFESDSFDSSGWKSIEVPRHIQLQGYGRPQYCNVQYPWDGHEQLSPGQVPQDSNPVGSYIRFFATESLREGWRASIIFNGAESALAVWLNGQYIGYACDSFTPSEFDVTSVLRDGVNKLAVQVFRFCAASWIEDQDFFRFSGLFRSVAVQLRPPAHIEDICVTSRLTKDRTTATVTAELMLVGQADIKARLGDEPMTIPAASGATKVV